MFTCYLHNHRLWGLGNISLNKLNLSPVVEHSGISNYSCLLGKKSHYCVLLSGRGTDPLI